jgi:hypothetical protein
MTYRTRPDACNYCYVLYPGVLAVNRRDVVDEDRPSPGDDGYRSGRFAARPSVPRTSRSLSKRRRSSGSILVVPLVGA